MSINEFFSSSPNGYMSTLFCITHLHAHTLINFFAKENPQESLCEYTLHFTFKLKRHVEFSPGEGINTTVTAHKLACMWLAKIYFKTFCQLMFSVIISCTRNFTTYQNAAYFIFSLRMYSRMLNNWFTVSYFHITCFIERCVECAVLSRLYTCVPLGNRIF